MEKSKQTLLTLHINSRVEKHLLIAVNQNNLEATISYANFLKPFKQNFELGNKFYQRAKELDTDNIYSELIEAMSKRVKG